MGDPLGRSNGFTNDALPAIRGGGPGEFRGLGAGHAHAPVGTAYAVWVGTGAALTAGYAMWSGAEPTSPMRVVLLLGIVGCVIGLKVTH